MTEGLTAIVMARYEAIQRTRMDGFTLRDDGRDNLNSPDET
jgi:hypothetical protein